MSTDLKNFLFILREYQAHLSGFRHMRAWNYEDTQKRLREAAAFMIGLGVNKNAMPYEYRS